MQEISVLSFVTFFLLSLAGAYLHYRKVVKTGRHTASLWKYIVADYPLRSSSVGVALLIAAWGAATAGIADQINPELVWTMLMNDRLHVPSVTVAGFAVTTGIAFDSTINKGGNEK